ncbi:MAG: hypothetical protein HY319_01715 [Armatimonadetes bacterium]|nr:hypothetical protein [Armatimonadota bacterium]
MTRRGLTLVEIIVSAALLVVIFMLLLNLFPLSLFGVRQAEHRAEAVMRARSILESLSGGPFSRLENGSYDTGAPGPYPDLLAVEKTEDGVELRPALEIGDVPAFDGNPYPRLKRLKVTIAWEGRHPSQIVQELRVFGTTR